LTWGTRWSWPGPIHDPLTTISVRLIATSWQISEGTSMREHWQSGYEDTKRALRRKDWLTMPPHGAGIVVHDVHREDEH
jgi:Patatin phospholipase